MARSSFDAAYEKLVLGREFVEFRDYYVHARRRYERTLALIGTLGLPGGARHLDVGGGQMALLTAELYGFAPIVGDVVPTSSGDVEGQGVAFQRINLMDERYEADAPYDLVTLCEVIEHIPVPPYVTFRKLSAILKPGGWLVMTTPNGFRVRNVLRMLANREVLDIYRYPEGDEPLGHQHEYTLRQMDWQLRHAGYEAHTLRTYDSGWRGVSTGARIAHALTVPFGLFPHLRDGILVAARAPSERPAAAG
jgi:SAM-dependent methyltransferase